MLKIKLRAKNVKNHKYLRSSEVSKITRFAASFLASSQVTSETKHFFQLWSCCGAMIRKLFLNHPFHDAGSFLYRSINTESSEGGEDEKIWWRIQRLERVLNDFKNYQQYVAENDFFQQ